MTHELTTDDQPNLRKAHRRTAPPAAEDREDYGFFAIDHSG